VERLHDEERLRDRRLDRLRGDLAELVEVAFQIDVASDLLRSRERVNEAGQAWRGAVARYQVLTAKLAIEPSTSKLPLLMGEINRAITLAFAGADARATAWQTGSDETAEISAQLNTNLDHLAQLALKLIAEIQEVVGGLDSPAG
jgi:hypothetical protein